MQVKMMAVMWWGWGCLGVCNRRCQFETDWQENIYQHEKYIRLNFTNRINYEKKSTNQNDAFLQSYMMYSIISLLCGIVSAITLKCGDGQNTRSGSKILNKGSMHGSKNIFLAERSLLDIFSKKFFVYDYERTIPRWPWKFEPLGQIGSKHHLERE